MIATPFLSISDEFSVAIISDCVIMPDHVHGLIEIEQDEDSLQSPTLGQLVGWFKGMSRHRYSLGVASHEWPRYKGKFWQPGFHDHIVRDDRDYQNRMKYIERNPIRLAEKRRGEML
jgi:REP element-mobilizing transposase RayT